MGEELELTTPEKATNKADKPAIIDRMLDNLQVLAPDLTRNTLHGMVLNYLSYALCVMRVQFKETENEALNFPNLFMAFYLPSNMGKDRTSNIIKNNIFEPHLQNFQDLNDKKYIENKELEIFKELKEKHSDWDADKLEQKTKDIMSKERRFVVGCNSAGTPEGLYAEMAGLKKRKTGAVFVEQSESGAFAESKSERKQDFLTCMYQGYDNMIEGRNLVNVSYPTISHVPVVAKFMSEPKIVKENENFRKRQTTALGRRLWIFMQEDWKKVIKLPSNAERVTATQNLRDIGNELFTEIFKYVMLMNTEPSHPSKYNAQTNAVYNFDAGVYDSCFVPYAEKINALYNNTADELVRLSISEYPFRVCKIACIYAVLNHPQDSKFLIKAEDFAQAVKTVEETDCMSVLVGYAPESKDKFDYIVEKLISHYNSDERPENDLYGKAILSKLFEQALNGFKNRRGIVRELLSSDKYEETKAILKEELQPKGYDLIATVGSTSFAGFKIKKLNMPVETTETIEETEKDILSELFT